MLINLFLRNDWQTKITLVLPSPVNAIQAFKRTLWTVFRVSVFKQPTALRVVTSDLQTKLVTLPNDNIRWPDFNINWINLPYNWLLHIGGEIISMGNFTGMSRVSFICLTKGESESALHHRNWLACCSSIEDCDNILI